jgi:hypothetical protein
MNRWLKHSGHIVALGFAAALILPSALSSAPFSSGLDRNSRPAAFGQVGDDLLLAHCCHSHPYPPYDRYCCHGGGSVRVGAPVARTAVGAAATYGAYRGVRSATKSAYKHGYSKAKKSIKRRR